MWQRLRLPRTPWPRPANKGRGRRWVPGLVAVLALWSLGIAFAYTATSGSAAASVQALSVSGSGAPAGQLASVLPLSQTFSLKAAGAAQDSPCVGLYAVLPAVPPDQLALQLNWLNTPHVSQVLHNPHASIEAHIYYPSSEQSSPGGVNDGRSDNTCYANFSSGNAVLSSSNEPHIGPTSDPTSCGTSCVSTTLYEDGSTAAGFEFSRKAADALLYPSLDCAPSTTTCTFYVVVGIEVPKGGTPPGQQSNNSLTWYLQLLKV